MLSFELHILEMRSILLWKEELTVHFRVAKNNNISAFTAAAFREDSANFFSK